MNTRVWLGAELALLLTTGHAAGEEEAGSVRGVVRFTGAVPPARKVPTGDGGYVEHRDLAVDAKTGACAGSSPPWRTPPRNRSWGRPSRR
jgi:hypothetical protein